MIKIKMTPSLAELKEPFEKDYTPVVITRLEKTAHQVNENISNRAPKKSGRLRAAHKVNRVGDSFELYIDESKGVGKYVNAQRYGAAPREIRPKKAKALHWPGLPHPVKIVRRWPGIKGRDWVEEGIQASRGILDRAEEDIANDIERNFY